MFYDVLVTTPLFYSSGNPHIGHAYTLIIGDLIKKYYALVGKKAYLLSGVDEHGEKILKKAQELKKNTTTFVTETSQKFKDLWMQLDITPDCFLRTSNENHKEFVLTLFNNLLASKEIYLSSWTGYNCVSCETNYSEKYYAHKTTCEMGHELQNRSEDAYFLNIKKYPQWLQNHYNDSEIIIPEFYLKNLTQNFLNKLEDLSITRKNLDWGIKLKDSCFTIYVWFEALICYFSHPEIKKMWELNSKTKIIQVLGKEIIRFHSIYLPILLKGQKLKLPEKLLIHGWLLNNDRKISKSEAETNPIIPLNQILQSLNLESIKWYFIFLNWVDDHPFSEELIKQLFNKYIVNLFGNLINRLKGILSKNGNATSSINYKIKNSEISSEIQKGSQLLSNLESFINNLKIPLIAQEVVNLLENANKIIEKIKPWNLSIKTIEYQELNVYLYRQLVLSAFLLSPIFSGEKWEKIMHALSIPKKLNAEINLEYLNLMSNFSNIVLPSSSNIFEKYT